MAKQNEDYYYDLLGRNGNPRRVTEFGSSVK
jgi:hypothetical protein